MKSSIWDPNLVITVHADGLAPGGVGPSVATVLSTDWCFRYTYLDINGFKYAFDNTGYSSKWSRNRTRYRDSVTLNSDYLIQCLGSRLRKLKSIEIVALIGKRVWLDLYGRNVGDPCTDSNESNTRKLSMEYYCLILEGNPVGYFYWSHIL